jgi:Helix-turn-helix
MSHLLIVGTPADGFRYIGPVTPNDPDLDEYIDRELRDEYWWLVELDPLPVEEEPDLRKMLARAGMRQVDVAKALNVTQQAVSAWVNGRATVPQRLLDLLSETKA